MGLCYCLFFISRIRVWSIWRDLRCCTHTQINTEHFVSLRQTYLPAYNNSQASINVCVCQRDRADSRVSDTPPPRWLFPVASCPLPVYCSGMFQNAGLVKPPEHLTYMYSMYRLLPRFGAGNSMDNEIWILICCVKSLEMLFIIGYGSKKLISESSGR